MNDLVQQMLNEDKGEKEFVKDLNLHRKNVAKFIDHIHILLQRRAKDHDKSKYGDQELPLFAKSFEEFKDIPYGTEAYRQQLKKIKPAIDHHYSVNKHHPEYHEEGIKGMNLIDIIEMICDWKASSMRGESGDIKKSIEHNQERFGFSDDVKQILLNTVELLG